MHDGVPGQPVDGWGRSCRPEMGGICGMPSNGAGAASSDRTGVLLASERDWLNAEPRARFGPYASERYHRLPLKWTGPTMTRPSPQGTDGGPGKTELNRSANNRDRTPPTKGLGPRGRHPSLNGGPGTGLSRTWKGATAARSLGASILAKTTGQPPGWPATCASITIGGAGRDDGYGRRSAPTAGRSAERSR